MRIKKSVDLLDIFIKLLQIGYNGISIPYKYRYLNSDISKQIDRIEEKYELEIKMNLNYIDMSYSFIYYIDIIKIIVS